MLFPEPPESSAADVSGNGAGGKSAVPEFAPDYAEEVLGDKLRDGVTPLEPHARTVVGLGGSAGSLSALRAFFQAMPPDTGLTFVVVTHLLPDHESLMAEILQRATTMPVIQVSETVKVRDNCVYVIPPSRHLLMMDGHLQLTEMERERGRRVAVDLFLRTLADTHGPQSIGIILSGADADGAIGIKRIKERGGLTIVQEPEEAEQEGMPRSAIATGMSDWVLRADEMPARILEYLRNGRRLVLPPENREKGEDASASDEGGAAGMAGAGAMGEDHGGTSGDMEAAESALRGILTFLRTRTGRDFTFYKRATTVRRIARRMQVNNVTRMAEYLTFLRMHPGEAGALLQDLLISVTNFFRDRDAFEALEREVPNLFKGKRPGEQVRVWVAGCATGEEAYSLAMLLAEHAATLDSPPAFQIFATDLDDNALQQARAGIYPETIAADVTDERLRRFFTRDSGRLRVRTELRERVLFALHDLFRDSPFSRLDLITCRNLFIYVNRGVQQSALEMFHFALRTEGLLFLGSAESADVATGVFRVLDKKHRLYLRGHPAGNALTTSHRMPPPSGRPAFLTSERALPGALGGMPSVPVSYGFAHEPGLIPEETGLPRISGAELHLKLLESVSPPSVVVDSAHHIVHLAGHAGRWLQFSGGQPTLNLLRLVHPMLRLDVRAALFRAAEERGSTVVVEDVPVETESGVWRKVTLRVSTQVNAPAGFCLVVFEEKESGAGEGEGGGGDAGAAPPVISLPPVHAAQEDWTSRHLESELELTRRRLTEIQEQHRASIEEMKSGNEELQAMNEELRSAGEELVTNREELQSMNEELQTVNQEMKSRVEELSHTNADLQNLMGATNIATIFLDREFHIKRYTPPAMALFNLIPSDLGRPLFDLAHHLDYPSLPADARGVITTLVPLEKEVQARERWFLVRILPYRTVDDHIAGVVLSFVDITERRQAEEELREWAAWMAAQKDAFEAAVTGAPLTKSLGVLVSAVVARLDPGSRCAFYMADPTGSTLHHVTGMPDTYAECVDGFKIGPDSLACGLAVYKGERVITPDVNEAREWEPWRWLAEQQGYRGCWSFPIITESGVVGTFAMYFAAPRDASARERDFAANLTRAAAIIISRHQETERRLQAEQSLRESTGRLRLIIENARDYAIFTTDLERRVTSWNSGAEHLLGFTESEILGLSADVIFTDEDRARGAPESEAATALDHGRSADERWHRRKDGGIFWGGGTLMSMFDGSDTVTGFVKILRDQTEAREAILQLQLARAEAEAAGQAKDHFLAVLSHELRTPLTPVSMELDELLEDPAISPALLTSLEMIRRNVDLETRLIDDLLDITRIGQGKLEVEAEPVDLHDVIQSAIHLCTPDFKTKKHELTVRLEASAHQITGDTVRLQQVFWNLLKNAAKFTPSGGRVLVRSSSCSTSISVPGSGPGPSPGSGAAPGFDFIEVEVADNGMGWQPEVQSGLFDAFTQADVTVTRKFGGLGLGLAISKAVILAHHGTLQAKSGGPGQGAVFTVRLPLRTGDPS